MKARLPFLIHGMQDRRLIWATAFLLIVFGIAEDYLESQFRDFSFYMSESFLFSTHWLFLVPLTALQYLWIKKLQAYPIASYIIGFFAPVFLHILSYPAWVNLVSGLFFEHRFAYGQTLSYALSAQLIPICTWYALPLLFRRAERKTRQLPGAAISDEPAANKYIDHFIVTHGGQKIKVPTNDILYISAQSPYVCLHLDGRKLLLPGGLTATGERLNPDCFLRVHRSAIVQLNKVVSYQSRLNGDYDARLCDGRLVRVSRHYAAEFKKMYEQGHRLKA